MIFNFLKQLPFLLFLAACQNKNSPNVVIKIPLKTTQSSVEISEELQQSTGLSVGSYQQVQSIFQSECYSCHGQNGANAGNVGDVTNLKSLSDNGYVIRGEAAEKSKLFMRLISGTQPMPPAPKPRLSPEKIATVKNWIESKPQTRTTVDYASVYETIAADFASFSGEEKPNIRYFHLVNRYNSGAPDTVLEQTRRALSKTLNMLSTAGEVSKPIAIDTRNLVYRVNLKAYELDRPETFYTQMLKTIFPILSSEKVEKWFPDPEERDVRKFYGARYKEIFEGRRSESHFIQPERHTFQEGLPVADHPLLKMMAQEMRESAQKIDDASSRVYGGIAESERADSKKCQQEANPAGVQCSYPLPLVRADWFVSQVAGNMRMRIYYHASGLDDDTVTLDAALGIDDVEGFLRDNVQSFNWDNVPKEQKLMRAGFNNSGVSINHRSFERVPLDYLPGRPLWRAYEFKDKSQVKYEKHDLFRFPVGPIFEIGADGEVGYECINMMTDLSTRLDDGTVVRTLSLMDHGLLYPSKLPEGEEPTVVSKLKALPEGDPKREELIAEFKSLFGHTDFNNWRSDDYMKANNGNLPIKEDGLYAGRRMIQCELESSNPLAFRHETLEYLFLRKNGLQSFVNVGLQAQHIDYKIPNQRALESKEALLIPAHDRPELMVVGAPLSCLSCHGQGFIEKEDQVKRYVFEANRPEGVSELFWNKVKEKVSRYHVPFDELKEAMSADNAVLRNALTQAGVDYRDPEPIVETYRTWAIPGMTFSMVAQELELTENDLSRAILYDADLAMILREFKVPNATLKRSEFEKNYRTIMCKVHKSCKTIDSANIIPLQ